MSSQKGNAKRSRPQKYQNQTVFKNDLHDKTQKTKFLNNLDVANVCERCKKIIEWKIKYKKYKPLKAPAKCTKCEQKCVKQAYHIMCLPCAKQNDVCPKCGQKEEIIEAKPTKEESLKLDAELQALLKSLSERKRRTFIRYMNKNAETKKRKKSKNKETKVVSQDVATEDEDDDSENVSVAAPVTRDDLLQKLKELKLKDGNDELDSDLSNFADDDDDGDDDDDIDGF